MHESVRESLKQNNGGVARSKNSEDSPLETKTDAYGEIDIFPALQKYKDEHNTANLQKLLVEISEFCHSVYASTRNEAERKIYRTMIGKLNI